MFTNIVAIGRTRTLTDCAEIARAAAPLTLIENADVPNSNYVTTWCKDRDVPFLRLDKQQTMEFLDSIKKKTLVISCLNRYIFPKHIIAKENLTIINLHPSLLPKHRGRNPTAWAIYDGDTETGVTWHYINENIDDGYMIAQKSILINETMTAGRLYAQLCVLGAELFNDVFTSVFEENAPRVQLNVQQEKVRYAKNIPNDGIFDKTWSYKQASAFLRAMDFGMAPQFPPPRMNDNGNWITWRKYVLTPVSPPQSGELFVELDGGNILLKGFVTL